MSETEESFFLNDAWPGFTRNKRWEWLSLIIRILLFFAHPCASLRISERALFAHRRFVLSTRYYNRKQKDETTYLKNTSHLPAFPESYPRRQRRRRRAA